MRNNHTQAGFTLIEMIVVLAVLGMIAGLLLARGPTRSPVLDLTAASRSLTDMLRAARGRAIATDRPVRVDAGQARAVLTRLAAHGPHAGRITLSLHSPAGNPREDGIVLFNPDGGANGARIVMAEGNATGAITIDWLTGRIVQEPVRCCDAP